MPVIAYHAIFTTYGTWLPNDPRGSFSKHVYNEELAALGEIKYGRQYPQPSAPTLRRFRIAAIPRLKRPPCYINHDTRPVIAGAFGEVVSRLQLVVHACAIMTNHVHVVVRRVTKHRIEYIVGQLKSAATRALQLKHTPWSRGPGWRVFIDDEDVVPWAVRYVEQNPITAGMKPQTFDFVTPLDAWIESHECIRLDPPTGED